MIRAFIATLALAGAAHAQEMSVEGNTVVLSNRATVLFDQTTIVSVDGIDVAITYRSTPNFVSGVESADWFAVTVPDGYIAMPSEGHVVEDTDVVIVILPMLGS